METIVLDKRKLLFWLFGKKQENFGKNLCFYFNFFLILVVLREGDLLKEKSALRYPLPSLPPCPRMVKAIQYSSKGNKWRL